MKFGLHLYSIRNLVGTPEGFRVTAHKLKEMGYDTLQISVVPYDPELIASVSKETGMPIWQRSFHDHIIRDRRDYEEISQYIQKNPSTWRNDCFYTEA